MTHSRLFISAAGLLLLTACTAPKSTDLTDLLKNPLYAEQYYDAQVEHMVDLLINSGALVKDNAVKSAIDNTRLEGVKLARVATDLQATGKMGGIMSDTAEAIGEILLLGNKLYTGPDFQMRPSIDTHVYLSTAQDPRDGTFPDDTAVDLGPVRSSFGASTYDVSVSEEEMATLRSFILYDKAMKRILGFAQVQSR